MWLCVCPYLFMRVSTDTHMPLHKCGGQRTTSRCSSSLLLLVWDRISLLLCKLLELRPPPPRHLSVVVCWDYRYAFVAVSGFHASSRGPNARHLTCATNTSTSEPVPQPSTLYFSKLYFQNYLLLKTGFLFNAKNQVIFRLTKVEMN